MKTTTPPYKLVIVEDQQIVRAGLRLIINHWEDFVVVAEAGNGQEAIDQVGLHRPDLVLMDIEMPILNGIEATKEIKKRYPDIKVVMVTAYRDTETVISAFSNGARGYSGKEINPDKLKAGLYCVLNGDLWITDLFSENFVQLISLLQLNGLMNPEFQEDAHEKTKGEPLTVKDLSTNDYSDDVEEKQKISAKRSSKGRPKVYRFESSKQKKNKPNLTKRQMEILSLIVEGQSNSEIAKSLSISRDTVKTHIRHLLERLSASDRTQAAVMAVKEGYLEGFELEIKKEKVAATGE